MITQERLKELLHYDPDTGVFTWKVSRGGVKAGSEAGSVHKHRLTHYRVVHIDDAQYKAHRLAWLYVTGKLPDGQIDHQDGNGLHNWIKNLRDVNNRQNARNARLNNRNTSGFVGVFFDNACRKWRAQIRTESGQKHLGLFTDIEDAIDARKAANIEHGYHQNHGRSDNG